ncbi:MAG: hypothetical protein ACRELV_03890 [Longimicrobiales bacterium]
MLPRRLAPPLVAPPLVAPPLLALALLVPAAAGAQDASVTARNAVYVELLGNGLLYSMNYERRFTERTAGRVGAMFVAGEDEEGSDAAALFLPIMANFLFGDGNHHFEAGAGLGLVLSSAEEVDVGVGGDDDDFGAGAYGTGTLGYRYQRPGGGIVFRAGLTPVFGPEAFLPWLGVSIGYGF